MHVPCVCRRILYIIDANMYIYLAPFPMNENFSTLPVPAHLSAAAAATPFSLQPTARLPNRIVSVRCKCAVHYPPYAFSTRSIPVPSMLPLPLPLHMHVDTQTFTAFSNKLAPNAMTLFTTRTNRRRATHSSVRLTTIRVASCFMFCVSVSCTLFISTFRRTHAAFRENWWKKRNRKWKRNKNNQANERCWKICWQGAHDACIRCVYNICIYSYRT